MISTTDTRSQIILISSALNFIFCSKTSEIGHKVKSLPFYNSAEFTPEWIPESSDSYRAIHEIARFTFINQNGETVNNETLAGKIYVADFFFTVCPGLCPKLTSSMSKLQEEFQKDDDILLVSHTIMPWVDSVEVLHDFGVRMGIDPNKWLLLTGDQAEIYSLARKSYFAELNPGISKAPDEFIHTENFILVDGLG